MDNTKAAFYDSYRAFKGEPIGQSILFALPFLVFFLCALLPVAIIDDIFKTGIKNG